MGQLGEYLYCVIPCREDRTFDAPAIGDGGGRPHTVCHDGLACVVSDSPVDSYERTRSNLLAHEHALERVLQEFTLLPVRFATVAAPESAIEDVPKLLRVRAREFHQLLRDIQGKDELGLKAFWRDEKAIFQEVVAENRDIRRLRDAIARLPPSATSVERRQLGQMVKGALERKREQEAARMVAPLRRLANEVRENDTLVDRVVLNAAFLVDRGRVPEFDGAVNQLAVDLGARTALKYVGPTPPYNFVELVVNWQELQ